MNGMRRNEDAIKYLSLEQKIIFKFYEINAAVKTKNCGIYSD
jgi:hypothetical protein